MKNYVFIKFWMNNLELEIMKEFIQLESKKVKYTLIKLDI